MANRQLPIEQVVYTFSPKCEECDYNTGGATIKRSILNLLDYDFPRCADCGAKLPITSLCEIVKELGE